MSFIPGGLAAVVVVGAGMGAAYRVACRITGTPGISHRLCATAILSYWFMMTVGGWLLTLGMFQVAVAAALVVMLYFASRGRPISRDTPNLLGDVAKFGSILRRGFSGPGLVIALSALGIVALRLIRGLVAPPLAWDALTYHLVKAGRWVQTGAWAHEIAPDAWGYYAYYPPGGDLLWAWAMLVTRTDLLLAPAGTMIWLTILVGGYAAARSLGARSSSASAAALTVAMLPAVVNYLTSAYVENTTLALGLLSVPFLKRFLSHGRPGDAAVMIAALACAAATKVTALPFLLSALVVAGWTWRKTRGLRTLVLSAAACLPTVPGYARAWLDTGNPLYPLEIRLGETVVLPGNEERRLIHSARIAQGLTFDPVKLFDTLTIPHVFRGEEHLGLGPLWPIWGILGCVGAITTWTVGRSAGRKGAALPAESMGGIHPAGCQKRRARRWTCVLLLLAAGIVVAGFLSEGERALRTLFDLSAGRFLALPCAVMILMASGLSSRLFRATAGVATTLSAVLAIPLGWSREDMTACLGVVPALASAGILLLAAGSMRFIWPNAVTVRQGVKVVFVAGLIVLLLPWLQRHRDGWRFPIYAAAARGRAYDAHPLRPEYAASWPVWSYFDGELQAPRSTPSGRGAPYLLAVTAGFDGIGHNWLRYPLLGNRLQNEVIYVPPTADGSVVDYRLGDVLVRRADFDAWVARLTALKVDGVVTLPPRTLEEVWLEQRADLFECVVQGDGNASRAWLPVSRKVGD